ncbi:complement C1q subcomponent subunit C-like [Narcine bancroftii]|uniref:complement C1q subcomponent subunit C-like n=1 Tax=Narcine bancroftii TaxID=1343680 RepID=UPI00383134BC
MESNCIWLIPLLAALGSLVSGFNMISGLPGVPGPHGVPGLPGKDGRDGIKGAKGEPGIPDSTGRRGESGEKGDPGVLGQIGKRGRRGMPGDKGVPGMEGLKGEKGRSGDHKITLKSAFSAKRGGYSYPVAAKPIRFSDVISNDQNHYDMNTGVFTCNITGFYYFVYYATSDNNLCVSMMKNSYQEAMFCSHGSFDQVSSGGIVLHLQASDKVWITSTDYNAMMGIENHDSVFSGFLLFPD